jgi:hypothetical protein
MHYLQRLFTVILLTLSLVSLCSTVNAQERLYSEYEYDEVGNIIKRTQDLSGDAPSISSIEPSVVRQNQRLNLTLVGAGLRGATLNNPDGFFTFSNIQSSNEQITLSLTVDKDAEEGPSQISVSTGLGTDFVSLQILTELPDLRVSPTPLVLETGTTSVLNISLSKIDVLDHNVSVSIADINIASVDVSSFNFVQGDIVADMAMSLTAVANGRTKLNFESSTLGSYAYDLTVTDDVFELTPGEQYNSYGSVIGVNRLFTPPPPALVAVGPFIAELRISKIAAVTSNDTNNFVVANQVGMLKGSFLNTISPNAIGSGAIGQTITLAGQGLQAVDDVSILPADGVTISGVNVAASGEQVTLELDVAENTPLLLRQIVIAATGDKVPAANQMADRIYIGGLTPTSNSVSPIYFNRGDIRKVTVRGQHLQSVRSVGFDDESDLVFSKPVVNSDGTELSFGLQIVGFARLGPRMLILNSLLGSSTTLNVNANLIYIEDRPPEDITPVVSPLLGVERQVAPVAINRDEVAYAELLGVSRGNLLSKLMPSSRSQGSNFTLTIEGVGLNSVVAAEFAPAEGITVGEYTAAADGLTATLVLDIAPDATPNTRQLKLSDGAKFINAQQGADRFEVTLPKPQIESVQPIQIAQGTTSTLIVRGELLNDALTISLLPSEGIQLSGVTSNVDGTEVQAFINVDATAATGARIVQVTTPGGQTEVDAMLSNTLVVVEEISRTVTPILSPSLGITKEVTPVIETEDLSVLSAGLGIVKEVAPTPVNVSQFAYAKLVGISRGPVATMVSPSSLAINSTAQTIEISGVNLDDVTTVQTIPADGVTLNGPAIISADGRKITLTANVANDAEQTSRRVELITATGIIPFVNQRDALLRITGLVPEVSSIEPIQEVRGASFIMTIRGINFVDVQSVQASPANGITIGTPTAAADGRSISVQVSIASNAATEQKIITVTTSAGTTTTAAIPANTFTIISE